MHLCHLVRDLEVGGITNRVSTICNGLDPEQFMTSCLCLVQRGSRAQRLEPRVQVWALHASSGFAPKVIWQAARVLRRYRVDILHTHGWETVGYGAAAARFAGVPYLVHSDHGSSPDDDGGDRVPRWLGTSSARLADRLIATSNLVADQMASSVRLPRDRILVLPSGVDTERFRPPPERQQTRLGLGIDPEKVVIGSVGRLVRNRGHADLLEALSLLEPTGLDFSCMLVGEGPEEETLRVRARELGLVDRLQLVGSCRDVSALLWAMDLFVLPWAPPSPPAALLEAMACGLPCVAVNGGCIPQIVRDGDTGLLVPSDQPKILARTIEQLARSTSRQEALGQRTRAHVQKSHSAEAMTERYARMYAELMNTEA